MEETPRTEEERPHEAVVAAAAAGGGVVVVVAVAVAVAVAVVVVVVEFWFEKSYKVAWLLVPTGIANLLQSCL